MFEILTLCLWILSWLLQGSHLIYSHASRNHTHSNRFESEPIKTLKLFRRLVSASYHWLASSCRLQPLNSLLLIFSQLDKAFAASKCWGKTNRLDLVTLLAVEGFQAGSTLQFCFPSPLCLTKWILLSFRTLSYCRTSLLWADSLWLRFSRRVACCGSFWHLSTNYYSDHDI